MIVDRRWTERNLGFDPIARPAPTSTFAFTAAARSSSAEDLQREIIDFDSEGPEGREFLAFTTATGLSRFTDVEWPKGLAPKTGSVAQELAGGPLPRADVLLVTWTVDEGHALSRVLTPGKDSRNDYHSYAHNFASISQKMAGIPGAGGFAFPPRRRGLRRIAIETIPRRRPPPPLRGRDIPTESAHRSASGIASRRRCRPTIWSCGQRR